MAKSHGSSSSFRIAQDRARRIAPELAVSDLNSLRVWIQSKRESLDRDRAAVADRVRLEAADLKEAGPRAEQFVRQELLPRVEAAKQQLRDIMASKPSMPGIQRGLLARVFHRVVAYWRARGARRAVRQAEARIEEELRRAQVAVDAGQQLEARVEDETAVRLKSELDALRAMELLAESPEALGAVGELDVTALLQQLSDEFWVFHDVRLCATSFLRFAGKPVQSAQVDHLVVCPYGVFLIETKNWSRNSAWNRRHFDPYEQVGRAGLLCHCLLKDAHLPNRVRTIIASHQEIPSSRFQSFTEQMAPDRLVGYLKSRQRALNAAEVDQLAMFFQSRVATT